MVSSVGTTVIFIYIIVMCFQPMSKHVVIIMSRNVIK